MPSPTGDKARTRGPEDSRRTCCRIGLTANPQPHALSAQTVSPDGSPRQSPDGGHTVEMGYYPIETRENEEPGDWQPGKTRLLFRCQVRLQSGEDEETLFLVGPDSGNAVMVLWKESNYGVVGAAPLSWIKLSAAAEPEGYVRLLEGFLAAVHAAGTAKAADFTSIEVPPDGLLSESEVRAIFAKAFAE